MPYPKGCLLQPGKASLSMDVMVQRRPSLRTGYPIRFPERDRIIPCLHVGHDRLENRRNPS